MDGVTRGCDYDIGVWVDLEWDQPPGDNQESEYRIALQNTINLQVNRFLASAKNRQNLMNMILGNTGIQIP